MGTRILAAAAAVAAFLSPAAAADRCSDLAGKHDGVRVTRAGAIAPAPEWTPETASFYRPVPVKTPFCRIEAMIENRIGVEIWLPAEGHWNGRLLGAGVGGDAGVFNQRDMSLRLNEGFATVSTDSGHKAADAHWMLNATARTDYEHRATHLATLAAKALVNRYYGRAAARSYFTGCSGGGRQGLKEMQNYPEDYDGVVSGAPGPYMPLNSVRMMWFSLAQKHNPEAALSDADWSLYEAAVTHSCDALDGVSDGVIENPLSCRFDPAVLACGPGQTSGCLNEPKLEMLKRIVAPMPDEQGLPMDGGLLPGVRTRPGPPSPLLRAMFADAAHGDPNWDEDSFQRTADLARANQAMPELRADKTAIAPFIARGSKAILYQGWQDPSVIAGPTIEHYQALAAANGGLDELKKSVRLFMVPGMYHCGGGPGANQFGGSGHVSTPNDEGRDILWSLIRWVEDGKAPARIEASRIEEGRIVRTHPLCAFPESAAPAGGSAGLACKPDAALKEYGR